MDRKGNVFAGVLLLAAAVVILVLLYLRADSASARALLLFLLILVVLLGGVLLLWDVFHKPSRLRRLLHQMQKSIDVETVDTLKQLYLEIYELYMMLSEKHKRNFYARVMAFRDKIEEILLAAKKLELALGTPASGAMAHQRYQEAQGHFRKLPEKTKHNYYSSLMQWKEQLEKKM